MPTGLVMVRVRVLLAPGAMLFRLKALLAVGASTTFWVACARFTLLPLLVCRAPAGMVLT